MPELNAHSVKTELHNIANWWNVNSIDSQYGGFVGEVDFYGEVVDKANKGIILNSRILWFYSELALFSPNLEYQKNAERAFHYLLNNFDDKKFAGSVWELDYRGKQINGKKQVYAQCFCLYGYLAYYKLTKDSQALEKAFEYFHLIEKHALDQEQGGYVDALSQNWTNIDDFRLSEKDLNVPKTMNTHLHILEAYTALHQTAPDNTTQKALTHVITIFQKHIIDHDNGHLKLFFDNSWNDQSLSYSFGHDIEASWLIWEALEVLGDKPLLDALRPSVIKLAETCLHQGIGNMGQLCDDYKLKEQVRSHEGVWWVQAEALIGFLNAFKLSGELKYSAASKNIWSFICQHQIDAKAGEWHGIVKEINNNFESKVHYKVGFWKAPYHNGRAMMKAHQLLESFN